MIRILKVISLISNFVLFIYIYSALHIAYSRDMTQSLISQVTSLQIRNYELFFAVTKNVTLKYAV